MKKLIAYILTLSMIVSMVAVSYIGSGGAAVAEATEETVAEQAVTPAPQQEATPVKAPVEEASTQTQSTQDETAEPTAQAEQTASDETVTQETVENVDATTTPDATQEGIAETVDDAVEQAAAEATPTPAPVVEPDVGSGPAWIVESAHRRYGELTDLLPIVMLSGQVVYLCTTGIIQLSGYTVDELSGVGFGIDTDALGDDFCDGKTVIVSAISRSGKTGNGAVYVWIGRASDIPSPSELLGDEVEMATDDELLETEIQVQTETDLSEPCAPTFTLTAYPELTEGMTFAVIVGDGQPQAIDGNVYAPTQSGVYRFAVLDAQGALTAKSSEYTVIYADQTATPSDGVQVEATVEPTAEPTETVLTEEDLLKAVTLAATTAEAVTPELSVQATGYVDGTLSQETPTFTLTGAPAEGGYYYGLTINGSNVVRLRADTYAVTESGDYLIVFYLLDSDGNTVATSGQYHVVVDYSIADESNEAWMAVGNVKLYGTLASLLDQADAGASIYLLTGEVLAVSSTVKLEMVNIAPDPDHYGSEYSVVVSDTNPDGDSAQGVTYVWLGVDVDETSTQVSLLAAPTFTIDNVSIGERNLYSGIWVNGSDAVILTLTDSDTTNTYTYEISTDNGVTYSPFGNGAALGSLGLTTGQSYAVVFRVTASQPDDGSNVALVSYTLSYDDAKPVLICKAGTDNTLSFFAGDATSGFFSASEGLNNVTYKATASAINWVALLEPAGQGVYSYSVQYKGSGTIPAGTLAVRDAANNITTYGKDITISAGTGGTGTGGMTTGSSSSSVGGGTTTSRSVYHSASDYTTVTAYNGVELVVETGTMDTLVIGDQQLDLTLGLDKNQQYADDYQPSFTADFTDWSGSGGADSDDSEDATVDTLVLTADTASVDSELGYIWSFDGSVYKKLAASGIDYLVLTVGDNVTAVSTAGFAAGIRYNMYRASGIASKAFVYSISMSVTTGEVQVQVAVDGQTYTLTDDQTSEFYYYNLYCGKMDMLNQPFGQGAVRETAADGRQG